MSPKNRIRITLFVVLAGGLLGVWSLSSRALADNDGTFNPNVALAPPEALSGAAPGAVVINEVVTDPQQDWSADDFNGVPGAGSAGTNDEWLELYIATAGLDLTGWIIELNDTSPVSGDLTGSGAFQVSNYSSAGGGTFNNTAVGDYLVLGNVAGSGQLNNDILIILKDNTAAIIDTVEIGDDSEGDGNGDGAPDGITDGDATGITDEAIARLPNAIDTDNDVSDFVKQAATIGTNNNGPVTAITLVSFTVEAGSGNATMTWVTGTEIDNAGFNLYRSTSAEGPWQLLNDTLIPADGDPLAGASYTFVDAPGRGTFYYQLEDIDYHGLRTDHGPVVAELGPVIRRPWFRPVVPRFLWIY